MRLGAQPCHLLKDSVAQRAYQTDVISERHRHRYEFNNLYRHQYEAHGMRFSGLSPDGGLVEILELPNHPHFVAVQFHPEFKSKPTRAHPLFAAFVNAAMKRRTGRKQQRSSSPNSDESAETTALTPP